MNKGNNYGWVAYLSKPSRPPLIINGIDFNERLDQAKDELHYHIDWNRYRITIQTLKSHGIMIPVQYFRIKR